MFAFAVMDLWILLSRAWNRVGEFMVEHYRNEDVDRHVEFR